MSIKIRKLVRVRKSALYAENCIHKSEGGILIEHIPPILMMIFEISGVKRNFWHMWSRFLYFSPPPTYSFTLSWISFSHQSFLHPAWSGQFWRMCSVVIGAVPQLQSSVSLVLSLLRWACILLCPVHNQKMMTWSSLYSIGLSGCSLGAPFVISSLPRF